MNWKPFVKLATQIGPAAVVLAVTSIMTWEGYSGSVIKDPIGRYQVCYGHDDQTLQFGTKFSKEECEALLASDVIAHADVLSCVDQPDKLTDGEKAAVISFAYNVGVQKACGSTFIKRLSAGEGKAACSELSKWTYAGGKQFTGLINRRAYERTMCEND